jgi:ATPase family protein associated with various cellular activities (AAA)/winged helix domain-containing protein
VVTPAELASAELRIRLGALLRGVSGAVERRAQRTAALARPEISHLAITDQHAHVVLQEAEAFSLSGRAYGPGTALTDDEVDRLQGLEIEAAAGLQLPGRLLRHRGLSELDLEILLLTAAPGVDPSFATLYGYVHDAMSSVSATPYLAVEVLATDCDHERRVIESCGPFGTLRSEGFVTVQGPERAALTALRAADGVVELLWGASIDGALLGRRPSPPRGGPLPAGVDAALVAKVAGALREDRLDVVGVWGPNGCGGRAVAVALLAERPAVHTAAADLEVALQRASISDAVCVVDVPSDYDAAAELASLIAASSARVVMLGEEPLRSPELMVGRRFAELRIPAHGFADRRASWSSAFPDLDDEEVDDLAARFRLLPDDIAAVASLERSSRDWSRNGHRPAIDALASLVSRRRSPQVATIRTPDRGLEMLVLPPAELAQVMEVAAAIRAWPRVAEDWRLDRFGNPGVSALFAGDPGTGKTLAAEVIATAVGLDLMVVDLSRLVSKWIGETEKNLDAVFNEAEASSCVLFFDEADSMFGQRGEVERGADRYANLEVGYLLQRLERYGGLVILASNLRANLDPAFTRRFHHVVHFPRPDEAQRRRLWEVGLAPPVQLAEALDLDLLAALELTGASIAAIVRSAALAVHADGRRSLTIADVLTATGKQFQREARLLPRELLGPYAALLA